MTDATTPLGGRYQLERRLGASRAAEVLLAQDRQLGRAVAVKLLSSELSRDPAVVERFRRAATAAATLTGPNVVTVYDWGEDQGRAYVAMELVDGESLSERLAASPRLGVDRAAMIGAGIAAALDVAHRAGQVHGSLTPRDVLLARDGTVKVTDFGTAAAGLASAGTTAAEAATYAAPEQLQGDAATPASDLYALGVVLSEMVAGGPPFTGDPTTITRRKLEETPTPPSLSATGVPPAFDGIVGRLLERDPARRYGSASEVARDLGRLRETLLTPAVEPPTQRMATPAAAATALPTAPPEEERNRSTPWIVAAIVLVLVIGGALLAWALTRSDDDGGKQVTVPAVVGERAAEAAADITDAGLSPSTVSEPNDDFAAGIVFSQAPKANEQARQGSVVVLKVSAGPTTTTTSSTTTTSTSTTSTSTSTTTTSTTTTTTTTPPPST